MRRLLAALLVVAASLPSAPVAAQTETGVALRLLGQTVWNGPQKGHRVLDVRIEAVNGGTVAAAGLSLVLTVFAPVDGRLEYEESLTSDATAPIAFRRPDPVAGVLAPGQTRSFEFHTALGELVQRNEAGVYPMKLELRSLDVTLAAIRSPIVFVTPQKEVVPLTVSTTLAVGERYHETPAGAFADRTLEQAVAEGGSLADLVAALRAGPAAGLTLAVSPLLLEQLADMRGGYRVTGATSKAVAAGTGGAADAASLLDALREVAGQAAVEVAGYPFAGPSFPALAAGGLDGDIGRQLGRGAGVVQTVLGRAPAAGLIRPPSGLLDAGSLDDLEGQATPGGPALVLDPGTALTPAVEPNLGFSPVASGRIATQPGRLRQEAILPNANLAALLDGIDDPVLRAHAAIGELSVIYGEQPGKPRGVAVLLPENRRPPGAFLRPFLEGLHALPFLHPVTASALLEEVPSEAELTLTERTFPTFSLDYEGAIRGARADLARFRSIFSDQPASASEMAERILVAEAQQFIRDDPGGRAFLSAITRTVEGRLAKIQPPRDGEVFTLASRNGRVPVTIRNLTGGRVNVRVTLLSSALRFAGGGTREILLDRQVNTSFFTVQTRRGGRFPVDVVLCAPRTAPTDCTPDGAGALASSQIIIRSTVYNRVALLLTIGAALFLLAGWGRRVLRRART